MKKYVIEFCKRGLFAAAGGPVVLAIVYGILGSVGVIDSLSPDTVCKGILTVTFMAFSAAGITMVYQIERLPLFSALLIHGMILYADYILIYLLNGWLQHQLVPILIFTVIFVAGYGVIWLLIYLFTKSGTEQLTRKLQNG